MRWGEPSSTAALVLLLPVLLLGSPAAFAAKGNFYVESAYAELREGVYYINAQIDYGLPPPAEEALLQGVTINIEVQIEVERRRRFWLDRNIAELAQHYSLRYHALSERYVVNNENSGEQLSFSSLDAALQRLGDLRDIPVLDAALLEPSDRNEVRVRAVLDRRRLPPPLVWVAAIWDDWGVTSKWYRWGLEP